MADPKKIENAIRSVRNQKAFIQELLIDALGWDIETMLRTVPELRQSPTCFAALP